MVKPALRLSLLLLTAILSSCVLGEARQKVLSGTLSAGQGDYQGATIAFLGALDQAGGYEPWIQYNLGNVYHSLGEVVAAQNMWALAGTTQDTALLYAVRFNQGVAWYETGRYDLAVGAFRDALMLAPSRIEAKINLELALQNHAGSLEMSAAPATPPPREGTVLDTRRLLEYVERKELAGEAVPEQAESAEGVKDW